MPDRDEPQQPPRGIGWRRFNVLLEVARLATDEYEREKTEDEQLKGLVVCFEIDGNKNNGEERKGFTDVKKSQGKNSFGPTPKELQNTDGKETTMIKEVNQELTQAKRKSEDKRPKKSSGVVIREPEVTSQDVSNKKKRKHGFESLNEEEKKPKRQIKKNKVDLSSIAFPEELPSELRVVFEEMNGTDLMLVIRKALTKTDISKNHGRLSIPQNHVEKDFLTDGEKKIIDDNCNANSTGKDKKTEVTVVLIDPWLRKFTLNLRRWDMRTSAMYVLVSKWNEVVTANGLKEDDVIQLWSFRSGSRLCLALVLVRRPENAGSPGISSAGSNEASSSGTK